MRAITKQPCVCETKSKVENLSSVCACDTPFVIATAGTRRQLQVEVELFDVCKLLNILL